MFEDEMIWQQVNREGLEPEYDAHPDQETTASVWWDSDHGTWECALFKGGQTARGEFTGGGVDDDGAKVAAMAHAEKMYRGDAPVRWEDE